MGGEATDLDAVLKFDIRFSSLATDQAPTPKEGSHSTPASGGDNNTKQG